MLEAIAPRPAPDAAVQRWRALVLDSATQLGWPPPQLAVKRHAGGASLVLSAPLDQLFTATEINEWAWQRAAGTDDGFHAPGHPVPWDEALARRTLTELSAAERSPALLALHTAALAHDAGFYLDDEQLSLGEGHSAIRFALDALPAPASVNWAALARVPKALVTGSNGKTTTVRLIAAMLREQGLTTGHCCTDGVFVDDLRLSSGDWSGPAGARTVLRDARVHAAVLETARGGILRRGLAVTRAETAVVTGISSDHFGEYGVHDLDDLAATKLAVARALDARGLLVLNADDPVLRRHAATLTVPIGWFARSLAHPLLAAHLAGGGSVCAVRADELILNHAGVHTVLGRIDAMPLTLGGLAGYNVANLAAAALAAVALGVSTAAIAAVAARFGSAHADNVGRLQRWRIGSATVLVDYAHNPEGLDALLGIAGKLREAGRLGLLLGQAGNRGDAEVRSLADVAARHDPQRIVLKDISGFLRGRQPGEVPGILRARLIEIGVPGSRLDLLLDEAEAARELVSWAQPGDVIVLPVHGTQARQRVCGWLDAIEAGRARVVDPLPPPPAPTTAAA